MRAASLAAPLACALALAGCGDAPVEPETVKVALDQAAPAPAASAPVTGDDYGATPMEERVAVLGLLNKRNNVSRGDQAEAG